MPELLRRDGRRRRRARTRQPLTAELGVSLGGALTAAYLHGSAALGGWNAERSDVDVLFVVGRRHRRR